MEKIIIHWTAGTLQPCYQDYQCYHFIINGNGFVFQGKYTPEDNINCYDGKYAKHCGGGNTGAIGIAVCGMYGFKNREQLGKYPLTKVQCEKLFSEIARLCKKYRINITPETVLTHYEFGKKHPNTTSKGKIDIIYLPPYPDINTDGIGDFIRSKARWYYEKK
jgi:hypothetical protein